jgi:hypothetical protein
MRKPTASERRLIAVFGLLVFLLANFVALKWYSALRGNLSAQAASLTGTAAEYRSLLAERPRWEARRIWMESHPLDSHQGAGTDSQFAEEIQKTLTRNGLSIDAQQLDDPSPDGRLVEARIECTIKGRLEQIVRWLCDIQQPGRHLVVEAFTLRQTDDGDVMTANVRLGKVFRAVEISATP